jgi:MYXO-CTERM domain-containing protein
MQLAVGALALSVVSPTYALTPPMGGAVSLPGDHALSLPFPEGTPVRASCAYGPDCSGYHVNTNVGCCTNDYYALDLIRDQAGNGNGEPVTAMASGTVIYADWATGGFASFGRYIALQHDYDADGHAYFSIYAHLSAISVNVGEHVEIKQTLGNLGGSSNMLDDQFGYHVHVAVYQDATLGAGGMHGGLAVVPEPIDGFEDLGHGTVMVAGAGPETPPPPGGSDSGGDATGGLTTGASGPDGGDGDATSSTSAGDGTGGGGSNDGTPPGGSDGGGQTSAVDGGGEALPDFGARGDDGGCACTTGPSPTTPRWAWVTLVLVAIRRRRR